MVLRVTAGILGVGFLFMVVWDYFGKGLLDVALGHFVVIALFLLYAAGGNSLLAKIVPFLTNTAFPRRESKNSPPPSKK